MSVPRTNTLSTVERNFVQERIMIMRSLASLTCEQQLAYGNNWDGNKTTPQATKGTFIATGGMAVGERAYALKDALQSHGWVRNGFYSVVFEHPEDDSKVLKLFMSAEDDGCLWNWVQPIYQRNLSGLHMPTVFALDNVLGTPVAVMPKYKPCTPDGTTGARYTNDAQHTYSMYCEEFGLSEEGEDIHGANVMFDDNGIFIITDPCC